MGSVARVHDAHQRVLGGEKSRPGLARVEALHAVDKVLAVKAASNVDAAIGSRRTKACAPAVIQRAQAA